VKGKNAMSLSIKDLYAYALAEGEGVGTAYEYYAKRRAMAPLLRAVPRGGRILVAGLPEKYGTSLDFVLAASEHGARPLVVDDRPLAIERARKALEALPASAGVHTGDAELRVIPSFEALADLGPQDLILSCEVVQRLRGEERRSYVRTLRRLAPRGVVFVPNSENGSHLAISHLAGLDRRGLADLFDGHAADVGFVDLPPFPPGIKRSDDQRARASSGAAEAIAMRGLEVYAAGEPLVPSFVKRHFAHIVYATWSGA
jgi:hypothetical protein